MKRPGAGPVLVGVVVTVAVGIGLLLVRPGSSGLLDPDSPAPDGTRALVHVLRDHGIDVRVQHRFDALSSDVQATGTPVTVVVARPDRLGAGRVADLDRLTQGSRADLVLVGAQDDVLADLDLPLGASPATSDVRLDAACEDGAAGRAGAADLGADVAYTTNDIGGSGTDRVRQCYPTDPSASAFVQVAQRDGRSTTLLGSGAALTNDRLGRAGNAALGVGVLGHQPVLEWWVPDPLDGAPRASTPTLGDLTPDWVRYGALQLVVVLAVLVVWRSRRFGRLVREPLPVVVRSIETTRGRAQLYRRARASGRAAQVLRAASLQRLAVGVGLSRSAPPPEVAAAVARASGRALDDVEALLLGPDPADDATLVRLARDLDALEKEVHRT
ncbi:DUF4350 domain-containing protein [Angustibacter luteus]|uniref:DUF4350 domain-containing protein n=1 Tax=Angustibacter luteus TaxID=658456 RepID=A0ABW1JHE3_9ACTN